MTRTALYETSTVYETSARYKNSAPAANMSSFVCDVSTLRARARKHMRDAAPIGYGLDPNVAIKLLNNALATELVCAMRYRQHSFAAKGINSEPIAAEFLIHSNEELSHADQIARRIIQLGGSPDLDPASLTGRSHAEYTTCSTLKQMVEENLFAERIAIETYREMIRYFGDADATTREMLEAVLAKEEEHADELSDLLD